MLFNRIPPRLRSTLPLLVLTAACAEPDPVARPTEPDTLNPIVSGTAAIHTRSGEARVYWEDQGGDAVMEGDILLGRTAAMQARSTVVNHMGALWPDGVVPWETTANTAGNPQIANAIAHWEANTPLRFRAATPADANRLRFEVNTTDPITNCSSFVGMVGGVQQVTLDAGCSFGSTVHEIGHAVGLWHEHTRRDRDEHVEVHWECISDDHEHNFEVRDWDSLAVGPFDFDSIMLYGSGAWQVAVDCMSLTRLDGSTFTGQRAGLSTGDIAAIETLYGTADLPGALGDALATGDFNGDGTLDLAVGAPTALVDGAYGGRVFVYTADGNSQLMPLGRLSARDAGSDVESGDDFGAVLAAGDFNNDGIDDLAVGLPGAGHHRLIDGMGLVYLYRGTNGGLVFDQVLAMSTPQAGAGFGAALALGDFDGDGADEVAVGAPFASVGLGDQSGQVYVYDASEATTTVDLTWGLTGAISTKTGAALAAGDTDGDGYGDLAVGVPNRQVGGDPEVGQVSLMRGGAGGLGRANVVDIPRASAPPTGSRLGSALAIGRIGTDGHAELAIGAPGYGGSGAVYLLGGGRGDRLRFIRRITQTGLSQPTQGDGFGQSVAFGKVDGDTFGDLVVGAPSKLNGALRTGMLFLFRGRADNDLRPWGTLDGVDLGVRQADGGLGTAIAVGDLSGDGRADLWAGAPGLAGDDGAVAGWYGPRSGPPSPWDVIAP